MAYAGQKFLRLFYTFGDDELNSHSTSLRELRLEFPLSGGATRFAMGGEAPPILQGLPVRPSIAKKVRPRNRRGYLQDFDDHYCFTAIASKCEGRRAAGWLRVAGPNGSMTVAVRNFWRLYPKALAADARAVKVGLMPPLCEDQYAQQAKDPAKLVHYYYNLLGGRYKIKQGQAKTHKILIAFDERPKLDAFQQDVMATAPSAWVCGSLALGEIRPPAPPGPRPTMRKWISASSTTSRPATPAAITA